MISDITTLDPGGIRMSFSTSQQQQQQQQQTASTFAFETGTVFRAFEVVGARRRQQRYLRCLTKRPRVTNVKVSE